jgi:hypothetical protein
MKEHVEKIPYLYFKLFHTGGRGFYKTYTFTVLPENRACGIEMARHRGGSAGVCFGIPLPEKAFFPPSSREEPTKFYQPLTRVSIINPLFKLLRSGGVFLTVEILP